MELNSRVTTTGRRIGPVVDVANRWLRFDWVANTGSVTLPTNANLTGTNLFNAH
jgi:hypothetical protein